MSLLMHKEYISFMASKGGPEPHEYDELEQWFNSISDEVQSVSITQEQIRELWDAAGDAFSKETLQGFVCRKPHGYAGDYEIIDKIYNHFVSPESHLSKWDYFFHSRSAPKAVRNRKKYFHNLLSSFDGKADGDFWVLNVGSGPGRDVFEYLSQNPGTKTRFECVDMDQNAITYSQSLCRIFDGNVKYSLENIFLLRPTRTYNFVWSAGLFDYLDDRKFTFLLKRLYKMLMPYGQLVVGNFSPNNPTRAYMEYGEWFLNYRNEEHLLSLAEQSKIPRQLCHVAKENEGVNLFLHVQKDCD